MTRKDLQEKYNIFGDNKDITLYRKKGEFSYGIGYCGNIELKNGKAIFQGKSYSTIDSLDMMLIEWEKGLPYPVDTYNPMMNDNYRIESRLCWYIEEKLKFKLNQGVWGDGGTNYIKEIGPDCQITFRIWRDGLDDGISITSKWGNYHLTQKVKNAEDGISIFNTIINSTVLSMAKDMLDTLSICDTKVTSDIEAYVKSNKNIFGWKKVDSFKDVMIERLETILKQLKEK